MARTVYERAEPQALAATRIGSVVALIVGALAVPGLLTLPALPMDDGTMVLYPALIRMGWMPYRDFRFLYGPAQPWLFSVLPNALLTERIVGIVARVVIAAGVYWLV